MIQIKGVGVDILRITRIEDIYKEHGDRFLNRIYTPEELKYVMDAKNNQYERLAALFCSKEAVFKTLQTRRRIVFREIEVIHKPYPVIRLYGSMLDIAKEREIKDVFISISHDGDFCIAFAIAV